LFLRYPGEINLLNQIDVVKQKIAGALKGYTPSARPFADFEKNGTYVSVLVINDLMKKKRLSDYIKYIKDKEQREIIVLGLEEQAESLSAQFPGAKQILKIQKFWECDKNAANL